MSSDALSDLVWEQMLMTRMAIHGLAPVTSPTALDRSATILLARLAADGPMTVAELSEAFGLDVSTVHRQLAAAIRAGLIEKVRDPDGGVARKHRPTEEGLHRLRTEFEGRRASFALVTADWSPDDVEAFTALMRRFNESVEEIRGQHWPRPDGHGSP